MKMRFSEASVNLSFFSGLHVKLDLARKVGDLVYGPALRDSVWPGDIPDGEEVMAVIALGHRASDPVKPTRKPLDEIAKFF